MAVITRSISPLLGPSQRPTERLARGASNQERRGRTGRSTSEQTVRNWRPGAPRQRPDNSRLRPSAARCRGAVRLLELRSRHGDVQPRPVLELDEFAVVLRQLGYM